MKNKEVTKQILKADLVKYCKQIGIVECEIPELVFSAEEYDAKNWEECEDIAKGGGYNQCLAQGKLFSECFEIYEDTTRPY